MKQLFSVAQRQPRLVTFANANAGRTASDHRRCARPAQALVDIAELEHAGGGLQLP